MGRQLFGTDGIRGVAGEYPLDPRTANALGAGLGQWVVESKKELAVVIGMDTRESGPGLAAEVAGGLARHGVTTRFAGITTTPGVAYLAKTGPFAAGVMISASHNPFQDNGIKVIGHSGYKLPDDQEEQLEAKLFAHVALETAEGILPSPAKLIVDENLDRAYIDHLASTVAKNFDGLRLVVDCANGSASHLAPALFRGLGAEVFEVCCSPDGRNINLGCGSLYLDSLRTEVLAHSADIGVAFDGDADRALFVSRSGKLIDGDMVMLVCARRLLDQGRLADRAGRAVVIATVMSNLGLQKALEADGVELVRMPVGDKYVLEEMLRRGAVIGGEQSGHVIFRDYATTGDGMLTALRVLDAMTCAGKSLDELTADFQLYPQILVNVRVKERKPLTGLPAVQDEIRAVENSLGDAGRVLVRFSGTEPLARVMVEGPDAERVELFANRIASQIRSQLGAE
ncbi:MAG: phosphoglucosamine mutase [Bryobacteraceae bacterium]